MLLACLGVYGVVASTVAQGRRGIGVRLALGAMPIDIVRITATQGFRPAVVGAVLGLPAAVATAYFLRGLLFGVPPFDLASFVVALAVLLVAAALASWWPARRATRVDPIEALRVE